jgi:hypothetical protein
MIRSDDRPKTISQAQIIGERGVALVKERVHAMGFLFTIYGPVEAGIDALIELRDPVTGRVGAKLIAVQVKTRDARPYTAETDDSFEYLCNADDVKYWQEANLPVIIVLVRLSDRSIYWKPAPPGGRATDLESRRLRISKTSGLLDAAAGDALALLAIDQAQPGTWLPPSRKPDELFFNAVKVVLPPEIQVAAITHRHGRDALKALLDISDSPPAAWVAKGGRLITFLDIGTSLLRHITEAGSVETLPVEEFALHDDEDEQRLFVELLNRTFRAQFEFLVSWNRSLRLYYFPADGPGIDRSIRYFSIKKQTPRAVVKSKRRPDGAISYVRHSAFSGRFWREFDEWYMTIEPTYIFTRDGIRPDRFAGERISKLKRLENNAAIRGQFVMWRSLLTSSGQALGQPDLLAPDAPDPILTFEPVEMISVPVSVPDELWRARDAHAPPEDDEELPL